MKLKSVSHSAPINDPNRCQRRTITGKRCRLRIVDPRSGLCFRHSSLASDAAKASDLRTTLAGDVTQFEDAQSVNKFLSNLLILLAEDRVSPRRGAVMAYTCNLILRTLSVHIQELDAYGDDEPDNVRVDFGDLPRPDRSQPSHASTEGSKPS